MYLVAAKAEKLEHMRTTGREHTFVARNRIMLSRMDIPAPALAGGRALAPAGAVRSWPRDRRARRQRHARRRLNPMMPVDSGVPADGWTRASISHPARAAARGPCTGLDRPAVAVAQGGAVPGGASPHRRRSCICSRSPRRERAPGYSRGQDRSAVAGAGGASPH